MGHGHNLQHEGYLPKDSYSLDSSIHNSAFCVWCVRRRNVSELNIYNLRIFYDDNVHGPIRISSIPDQEPKQL